MGKRYAVHSHHVTTVSVPAKTDAGHEVIAAMPASIIELVPIGGGATVTLTEISPSKEEREKLNALFPEGAIVEMGDFTLVEAPKKAAA